MDLIEEEKNEALIISEESLGRGLDGSLYSPVLPKEEFGQE